MNNLDLQELAKSIKLVAFDVDGVMTDGSLTFDEDGKEIKTFNAKDGLGVVMLNRAGITTSIITARNNGTVKVRAEILEIKELHMGQKYKVPALENIMKKYNLDYSEVAYMGDDLPDICVLERVGLKCCPNDAVDEVKKVCNYIAPNGGGRGAVRDLCDLILKAKNITYDDIAHTYQQ